ncbi:hypothetical protein JVU11DRAFT_4272 [Chiua virens]|nr:hypothetical protein JVU11DRAFT_4272 [Chiua virens]
MDTQRDHDHKSGTSCRVAGLHSNFRSRRPAIPIPNQQVVMNIVSNTFTPRTTKIFGKRKNGRAAHVGDRLDTDIINHHEQRNSQPRYLHRRRPMSGKAVRERGKWNHLIIRSPSLLEMCTVTNIRTKKQTKIFYSVKLARDNLTKLFKPTGRASAVVSDDLPSAILSPCVQDVHPFSASRDSASRVCIVKESDSLSSGKTGSEAIASLITHTNSLETGEHVENFEHASLQLPTRPPTALGFRHSHPHRFPINELYTIEEEIRLGDPAVDVDVVHTEPEELPASSLRIPLTTSDSQANYDAMLAADVATFSFHSDDFVGWSDQVEKGKQGRKDSYFASMVWAVPVPKFSAYFSPAIPSEFTAADLEESVISEPSPFKSERSDTSALSGDSSVPTSFDTEESPRQVLPAIIPGLRRIGSHEDLRSLHFLAALACSDSHEPEDMSLSFDLSPSRSPAIGDKTGALRKSVRCNDLRKSFASTEIKMLPFFKFGGIEAGMN